eukprot:XP_001689880.1 predicted protein [Chlamydomonas reinhardtii]
MNNMRMVKLTWEVERKCHRLGCSTRTSPFSLQPASGRRLVYGTDLRQLRHAAKRRQRQDQQRRCHRLKGDSPTVTGNMCHRNLRY